MMRHYTVGVLLLMLFSSSTRGFKKFTTLIPNGNYSDVAFGHERGINGSAGEINQFGRDFLMVGKIWNKILCEIDSDSDGKTNGEELGDPDCKWVPGLTESEEAALIASVPVTHPGYYDQFERNVEVTHTNMVMCHAILMCLTWFVVIPLAAFIPFVFHSNKSRIAYRRWYLWHVGTVSLGLILFVFGIGFIMTEYRGLQHFQTTHSQLGLAVVILTAAQCGLGIMKPGKQPTGRSETKAAHYLGLLHRFLGRFILILAIPTLYLGLSLYTHYGAFHAHFLQWTLIAWAGILFTIWIMIHFYRSINGHHTNSENEIKCTINACMQENSDISRDVFQDQSLPVQMVGKKKDKKPALKY